MFGKAAGLAILCVVLSLIAATTGAAAGKDATPGWSRPGAVREVTRVPERISSTPGRTPGFDWQGEELIESFRLLRVGREAILSLLLLRRASEKERIVASEIAEAVDRAATQIGRLSQG